MGETGSEGDYDSLSKVTEREFEEFKENNEKVVIENRNSKKDTEITLGESTDIKNLQPREFEVEGTNVWSFPNRGKWATHKGDFRGNWPPQLVRNVILRYSEEGDRVLDPMVGSGTTLIECKLLNREGIGVDINKKCAFITRDRLNFDYNKNLILKFIKEMQGT